MANRLKGKRKGRDRQTQRRLRVEQGGVTRMWKGGRLRWTCRRRIRSSVDGRTKGLEEDRAWPRLPRVKEEGRETETDRSRRKGGR
jgi:hypothetical protein